MGALNTFHTITCDGIQDEPKHRSIECECSHQPRPKPLAQIFEDQKDLLGKVSGLIPSDGLCKISY